MDKPGKRTLPCLIPDDGILDSGHADFHLFYFDSSHSGTLSCSQSSGYSTVKAKKKDSTQNILRPDIVLEVKTLFWLKKSLRLTPYFYGKRSNQQDNSFAAPWLLKKVTVIVLLHAWHRATWMCTEGLFHQVHQLNLLKGGQTGKLTDQNWFYTGKTVWTDCVFCICEHAPNVGNIDTTMKMTKALCEFMCHVTASYSK